MPRKRIGFVDYRLDNFHAEVYLKAFRGPLAYRGFEVVGATALLADPSRQWAEQRGLAYFDDVEQMTSSVDFFMVLAPSRPDLHLELCRQVFPVSAPTFVDKTFAPDEETARRIFALADEHVTPVQTTSALRTTPVQRRVRELKAPLQSLTVFASGTSFEEYGIHPVELVVSCLGPEADALLRMGPDSHPQWVIRFSGDRSAIVDFYPEKETPFSVVLSTEDGPEHMTIDGSRLFIDAGASILDFFEAGVPLIDREESLTVRRILDHAADPAAQSQLLSLRRTPSPPVERAGPHWNVGANRLSTNTADAD